VKKVQRPGPFNNAADEIPADVFVFQGKTEQAREAVSSQRSMEHRPDPLANHPDTLDLPAPRRILSMQPNTISTISRSAQRQNFIVAEELYDLPPLSDRIQPYLTKQLLNKLRSFSMPVLSRQMEASLSTEFGIYIMATPWSLFRPIVPSVSLYEASKLIQERLLYEDARRKRAISLPSGQLIERKNHMIPKKDIIAESDIVYNEIRTGEYSRYNDHSILLSSADIKSTPETFLILRHATHALSRNPSMHPVMKTDALRIINHFLSASSIKSTA
jgi:hypothetical protein